MGKRKQKVQWCKVNDIEWKNDEQVIQTLNIKNFPLAESLFAKKI